MKAPKGTRTFFNFLEDNASSVANKNMKAPKGTRTLLLRLVIRCTLLRIRI